MKCAECVPLQCIDLSCHLLPAKLNLIFLKGKRQYLNAPYSVYCVVISQCYNQSSVLNNYFQTNAVLLSLVIREILKMQSYRASNVEKFRQAAKACVVLSPLLGMTWVFGILSVTNASLVFQYIFTILNSLQVSYELLPLVTFVADLRIESIVINVRALTNLPVVTTSRQFCRTARAAHDQTTYPYRGRSVWPETALSLAALPTSHPTDQFGQMVSVLSFWCWRHSRCSAFAVVHVMCGCS